MTKAGHSACVDAWLRDAAKDLPPESLLLLFEAAHNALWAKTKPSLGEVTLTAIGDRVLSSVAERIPAFSSVTLDPSGGLVCHELRKVIGSMKVNDVKEGIRFALVEFLTVLGNLTAEILTPELHAELSRVVLPAAARGGPGEGAGGVGGKGARGHKGARGLRGARGLKGDRGEAGSRGHQGPRGHQGTRGEEASRGEAAPPGERGSQGKPAHPAAPRGRDKRS